MPRKRPLIAFFDSADVFEDFYPHYGVDQHSFATSWAATGGHSMASALQREVGDVIWYVLSLAPEFSEAQHEVVGCRVKILQAPWLLRTMWRAFYLPRMAWRWRRYYRAYATVASYVAIASFRLMKTLRQDRPDLIFVESYSTGRFDMLLLLARMLHIPLAAYHVGGQPEGYLGSSIRRWTLPRADQFILSGQDELQRLANSYGVDRERLTVILTPIDMKAFRPIARTDACTAMGLDPARRYLLFVGRLQDSVKRVSALIETFASIAASYPNTDLLIAGDGPDRARLESQARECAAGRVRFLGWISELQAKAELYNVAECLVLPSWREGFPSVVGEALACGTPVISSRVGGVSEVVINDQTGLLIPPGDDEALKSALSRVLANSEEFRSMRHRARNVAEARVSPEAIAAQIRECFARLNQQHGRSQ